MSAPTLNFICRFISSGILRKHCLNSIRMSSSGPPLHDMLKPVSWLLGKWRAEEAKGHYPTIDDFTFRAELEFTHVGQPNLQMSFNSWNIQTKAPMHRELGFLRVKPDTNQVALAVTYGFGLSELAEGEVAEHEMKTETHTIGRLTFGRDPATKKIIRHFKRTGDTLEQIVHMETSKTPLTEHLQITYTKVE